MLHIFHWWLYAPAPPCRGTFADFLDELDTVPIVQAIRASLKPSFAWGEAEEVQRRSDDEEWIAATLDSVHFTPTMLYPEVLALVQVRAVWMDEWPHASDAHGQ